ncbi:SusC/RagA family TonB-linked outer membrane protein [Carboxylicivirga taeanensis]|uniref:SusC/RagA family TonB-linked outer membrane protein n=1 Tax=Carboxylicivirga taeanensis TaxID=1416875 RepID=UPI003F6E132C
MKKKWFYDSHGRESHAKILRVMKLTLLLISFGFISISASTYSQEGKYSMFLKDAKVETVLSELQKCTDKVLFYSLKDIDNQLTIDIDIKDASLEETLESCLRGTGLGYKLKHDAIVLYKIDDAGSGRLQPQRIIITGSVTNEAGEPIPGVNIYTKDGSSGTITDTEGNFELHINQDSKTLVVSFIGMKTQEVAIGTNETFKIVLKEDMEALEDVVVTGYFNKSKESFTGAVKTIEIGDMQKVGALNPLQALGALDPSLRIAENLEFGSDPNRVPEITIRGDNGFDLRDAADRDRANPNSPLYVLDGVEVTAQRVYDIDMNRIKEMSVLKDASATALYGSRGANGVIIITTKPPESGEVRITFNSNFNFSIPDLRDYDLMNAEEKLRYEKLAGIWTDPLNNYENQILIDERYNEKLKEVRRGVDTYWLSKPLQTSVNQRYSTYFEGGDNSFRYGINLRYDDDKGVMKGSGRTKYGIDVTFNYNIGSNFFIRNDLLVSDVKGEDSQYGSFHNFARQNPHDRIYDEDGNYILMLSSRDKNPLIDADLQNVSEDKYTAIQDNFNIDWNFAENFRLRGRLSYTKQLNKTKVYRSPFSTDFSNTPELEKKGRYTVMNSEEHNFDSNITLSYNKIWEKHVVNLGVGSNVRAQEIEGEGFTATGFINDDMNYIEYASQYEENGKPDGISDKSRMVGFFGNLNYGFDNRYFIDLSYRTDGSSKFGKNSQFAPFWAVGLAWNAHKEHWWNTNRHTLKVRASAGSTGSVNFNSAQALTKYRYDALNEYNGIFGAKLIGYGNKSLKWQNTLSYNTGLDVTLFDNKVGLNVDAYIKITDNLLLPIDVAPSTGFRSYTENMGQMKNSGIEGRLRFMLVENREKQFNWSVTLAAFHNKNKIQKLSNKMEALNELANSEESVTGPKPLPTYQVGRSQSALMVVQSGGIDPATGNEIFIKLNGDRTFKYDHRDKIIVGDIKPDLEGNIISNMNWKGFNLYLQFRYEYGAKAYNTTLATKVEGSNPYYNADRRVLYDRWKEPGDETMFRRIDDTSQPYQTTRLVQDNDLLTLQSLSLTYTLPRETCKKFHAERLKLVASTTDVFRLSTIKRERGTSYPFARTFNLGLNVTF